MTTPNRNLLRTMTFVGVLLISYIIVTQGSPTVVPIRIPFDLENSNLPDLQGELLFNLQQSLTPQDQTLTLDSIIRDRDFIIPLLVAFITLFVTEAMGTFVGWLEMRRAIKLERVRNAPVSPIAPSPITTPVQMGHPRWIVRIFRWLIIATFVFSIGYAIDNAQVARDQARWVRQDLYWEVENIDDRLDYQNQYDNDIWQRLTWLENRVECLANSIFPRLIQRRC